MFDLKPLSPEAVPAALEKADRYRLLNEPEQAESICQDVLRLEPENQRALATLILAITDRFYGPRPSAPQPARELLPRLHSEYDRAYHAGIIAEREGIAWMRSEKPRADELLVLVVVAEDVADVLAQEALDALAELLHAVRVRLVHPPRAVRGVRRPRLERDDPLLLTEVRRDVGDEVLDRGERLHRLDDDGQFQRQVADAGHAHEPRLAVDLGGTRPALAGLAVPSASEVGSLGRLDPVDGVEDDHPLGDLGGVVLELPAGRITAPDPERRLTHVRLPGYFNSSGNFPSASALIASFNSSGIGAIGSSRTRISPSGPRSITVFTLPKFFESFVG
jgi:hypothetical protein